LLVFGDLEKGLSIVKASVLLEAKTDGSKIGTT